MKKHSLIFVFVHIICTYILQASGLLTVPRETRSCIYDYSDYKTLCNLYDVCELLRGESKHKLQEKCRNMLAARIENKLSKHRDPHYKKSDKHDSESRCKKDAYETPSNYTLYYNPYKYDTFFIKADLNDNDKITIKNALKQHSYTKPPSKLLGLFQSNELYLKKCCIGSDRRLCNQLTPLASYNSPILNDKYGRLIVPLGYIHNDREILTLIVDPAAKEKIKQREVEISESTNNGSLHPLDYPRIFHFIFQQLSKDDGNTTIKGSIKDLTVFNEKSRNAIWNKAHKSYIENSIEEKLVELFCCYIGNTEGCEIEDYYGCKVDCFEDNLSDLYDLACEDGQHTYINKENYIVSMKELLSEPLNKQAKYIDDFDQFKAAILPKAVGSEITPQQKERPKTICSEIALQEIEELKNKKEDYIESESQPSKPTDHTDDPHPSPEESPLPSENTFSLSAIVPSDILYKIGSYYDDSYMILRLVSKAYKEAIDNHLSTIQELRMYRDNVFEKFLKKHSDDFLFCKKNNLTWQCPKKATYVLNDFDIFLHKGSNTWLLKEKLNNNEEEDPYGSASSRKLIAIQHNKGWVQKDIRIRNKFISNQTSLLLLYNTPIVSDPLGRFIIYSKDPDTTYDSDAVATKTVYDPSTHTIKHYNILFGHPFSVTRLTLYPRLFNAIIEQCFRGNSGNDTLYYNPNLLNSIGGKEIDTTGYQSQLFLFSRGEEHFTVSERLFKTNHISCLFIQHLGDYRGSAIDGHIESVYKSKVDMVTNPESVDQYKDRIKKSLFKPVEQQAEHIDDFDQFKTVLEIMEVDEVIVPTSTIIAYTPTHQYYLRGNDHGLIYWV